MAKYLWITGRSDFVAEAAEWIEHYRRFWSDQLASLERFVTSREAGKEST